MQVTQEARGTVLELRGALDFDSVIQLREARERVVAMGRGSGPVVVGCRELLFCDSSGVAELLTLFRSLAEEERPLRLAAVPDPLARLCAVTGLDRVFTVYEDVERALTVDGARPHDTSTGRGGPAETAGEHSG
ncbi:STAS domain-containing protein [Streptomyces sp. NPDC097619]|uniref:STAS domain-containing protein n=1 Tax=Streptomyces sp. NPDC097619 TaxID=3157228 RepID=UPI0033247290